MGSSEAVQTVARAHGSHGAVCGSCDRLVESLLRVDGDELAGADASARLASHSGAQTATAPDIAAVPLPPG